MPDGLEQTTFLPEEVFPFEMVRLAPTGVGVSGERTDEPLVARAGLVVPHQMAKALSDCIGLPDKGPVGESAGRTSPNPISSMLSHTSTMSLLPTERSQGRRWWTSMISGERWRTGSKN